MIDTSGLHPTFADRAVRLLTECEHRGWSIGTYSTVRTVAQQKALWDRHQNDGAAPTAASPYKIGEPSPWGWTQLGSYHMVQADGYGHAIDFKINSGCTWEQFHEIASEYGIGFPLNDTLHEPWHAQWWDARGIYFDHTEEIMRYILAPIGSNARFIAPMDRLPNGQRAAIHATWLPTAEAVAEWTSRGVAEMQVQVADLKNVPLFGPLPTGDIRSWEASDFAALSSDR